MSARQLEGRRVLLGVSGSIAAYKAVELLRLLQKAGADVRVVMTPAAAKFVSPLTFASLSREAPLVDLWADNEAWTQHVHWGKWADAFVVAPASAHTLAKLAHGECPDALAAVYLSCPAPVLLAPAMDLDMYQHPSTQRNLAQLRADGVQIIEAESGYLASGLTGQGRLAEPAQIVQALQRALATPNGPLAGKRVVITAGPTQEPLDPVRYIGNRSTGQMGLALAAEAQALGASVTVVLGPTDQPAPAGVEVVRVQTALDMQAAVEQLAKAADIMLMAAAVSDYRLAQPEAQKHKKDPNETNWHLELVRNPDILAEVAAQKQPHQVVVGFALETEAYDQALVHATHKLARKNADMMVLNTLDDTGAGFGHATNRVTFVHQNRPPERFTLKPKAEVAADILQAVSDLLAQKPHPSPESAPS